MRWINYPSKNKLINLSKIESISQEEDMASNEVMGFAELPDMIPLYTIEFYVSDSEEPHVVSYEEKEFRDRDFESICEFLETKLPYLLLEGDQ